MRRIAFGIAALLIPFAAGPATAGQAKRAPAANWLATIVKTPEGGYRQGNPDAPVKLVEYGSRGCPTCGRFAAEGMAPLREKYIATGKVSYEFRDFLIHGPPDFALALLNQCVPAGKFFTVLDGFYAAQDAFNDKIHAIEQKSPQQIEAWQKLPIDQMAARFAEAMGAIPFMAKYGVTPTQARACLANPALIRGIAKTNAEAVTVHHVQSTPSFIVNGRTMRAFSWDQLQPELWAAGA